MLNARQVAIIGTGLLGGSIGLGLRHAGYSGTIVGIGRRQSTLDEAVKKKCIDRGVLESKLGEIIRESDLVILATPLRTFPGYFRVLAEHDHKNLLITDVGSTKLDVCSQVKQLLPDPTRFVGSHPMAGGEQHGPQHASPDLFRNRLCILTPAGTGASSESVSQITALWTALGMKVSIKSPHEHDALVAIISHLPHALAALLVKLAGENKALSIASTGFRDTTRIASGDPHVWTDIFSTNRDALLHAIDLFSTQLAEFRGLVDHADVQKLEELLAESKQQRDQWLKEF